MPQPTVLNLVKNELHDYTFKFDSEYTRSFCQLDIACCISKLPKTPNEYRALLLSDEFHFLKIYDSLLMTPGIKESLLTPFWVKLQLRIELERISSVIRYVYINLADLTIVHKFIHHLYSFEYLLLRMKYRFWKDIAGKYRSCLRKIYERDDSCQKPMILYVSDIFYRSNSGKEELLIEFCDGWYLAEFKIDSCIKSLIVDNKLFIGQKLLLLEAEVNIIVK